MSRQRPPEVVPVLSRGKHRNPRKGACFMEYASWLAGERWSDHPRCTHPLLATVARLVNDLTSDTARSRLVGLIPSVVGVDGDDPVVDVLITVRCAGAAIPVAAESRQRALAVTLMASLEVLDDLEDETMSAEIAARARAGLARAPHAARWAKGFTAGHDMTLDVYRSRSAPAAARVAIAGIAEAAIPDADDRLHQLLVNVIGDCRSRLDGGSSPNLDTARPVSILL